MDIYFIIDKIKLDLAYFIQLSYNLNKYELRTRKLPAKIALCGLDEKLFLRCGTNAQACCDNQVVPQQYGNAPHARSFVSRPPAEEQCVNKTDVDDHNKEVKIIPLAE